MSDKKHNHKESNPAHHSEHHFPGQPIYKTSPEEKAETAPQAEERGHNKDHHKDHHKEHHKH